MSVASPAATLLDKQPARSNDRSQECFSCGRRYTKGDGRFCHPRCREWFDAGNPPHEPGYLARVSDVPLDKWQVIAGQPDVEVGSNPCQSIIDASNALRAKRTAAAGDMIRPPRFCTQCGGRLPVWVNGKAYPSNRTRCLKCIRPEKARKRA